MAKLSELATVEHCEGAGFVEPKRGVAGGGPASEFKL